MISIYGFIYSMILAISCMMIGSCFGDLLILGMPTNDEVYYDTYVYKEDRSSCWYIITTILFFTLIITIIHYIFDYDNDYVLLGLIIIWVGFGFGLKCAIHEYGMVYEMNKL